MKKIYFLAVILISLGFIGAGLLKAAENNLGVVNNGAAGGAVYPSQWDIEALDFSLTPVVNDALNALTIKNYGLAPDTYFEKVILYADDGDGIFKGWKQDIQIGEGFYYDQNKIWYWKDLNIAVPKEGKKFFVTFETKNNGNILVDRRTIQLGIPPQYDENSDGFFDFASDTGIFMNSAHNGLAGGVINSETQIIHKESFDILPPKSVITYPIAGGKVLDKNLVIIGASRDQGGSTPSLVQINISKVGAENANWDDVAATGANYSEWKFNWNNIEDGTYTIKIKAADWIGNIGEETGITVIIDTSVLTPTPAPSASPTPSPTVNPTSTPIPEEAQMLDGDLIRVRNTFDVYIVKIIGAKKFKRLILNSAIFNSYGHLKWENVKDVLQGMADNYILSDLVIEVNADGSIANPKVYRVSSGAGSDVGQKRWLNITAAQFEAAGLDWDSLYKINHTEASKNFYPEEEAIVSLN